MEVGRLLEKVPLKVTACSWNGHNGFIHADTPTQPYWFTQNANPNDPAMSDVDNSLERIKAAKDRFILLSLVGYVQKLLDVDELQVNEYTSIIRAFLSRINASLFGQLTSREFELEFGKLFLQKRFARETFAILIQSLSDVDAKNSYKFGKIVDLIELIQIDLLSVALRDGENANFSGFQKQMADSTFSQTLCSYSDRIFNYFGASETKNLPFCTSAIRNYEEKLLSTIQGFLLDSTIVEKDLGLCAKVITDYFTISTTFTDLLVKWMIQSRHSLKVSPSIFLHGNVDARKQEQFIVAVFFLLRNGYEVSIIFGDSIRRHTLLKRIFTRKLLVERITPISFTPPAENACGGKMARNSRKIVEYLREIGEQATIRATFAELVQVFSDQSKFLNSVGFDHQFQLAAALIDFARALDESDLTILRHEVTMELASIVPEYLKLPDNCRRQVGMFVTEFITNLFVEDEKSKLKFEYNYDSVLTRLKAISEEKFAKDIDDPSIPANLEEEKPETKSSIEKKTKKIFVDSRTKLLDSDDDDEGETDTMNVEDKIFEEEIREHESVEQNRPHYIRDCLERLSGEKENFKNFAVALRTLPTLIRSKSIGFEDLAGEILDLMICVEDRFWLPEFQELRKESATLVLIHRPELVGHAVRVLFSNQCSMLNRFFILGCLDDAAAILAGEKSSTKSVVESKIEIVNDLSKKGEKILQNDAKPQQIGKVTRRAGARTAVTGRKNLFAEVVPQFVYPLLNVTKIGSHLDLYDRDSILMGKVLSTVGQMISYARSSPYMPEIISTVFTFLTPLRNNPQSFVLSGCLFCYSAIADAPMGAECFGVELRDALEWVSALLESTQSQAAADTMYRDTLFITYLKLRRAVYGKDDEVEGL